MRLLVLGATGNTGVEVVKQALQRGHTVKVLVRSPEKVPSQAGLQVVKGNVLKAAEVRAQLDDVDAVITSVGPNDLKPTTVYSDSGRAIVEAMRGSMVKRLAVVSVATRFPPAGLLVRVVQFILRHGVKDARVLEQVVRDSGLEWTILRPPRLTNAAARGTFREEVDALPKGGEKIARADLAAALLDVVEKKQFVQQMAGVCY